MKIGIMADSHDNIPNVKKTAEIFHREKVEVIVHGGDFIAPFALRPIAPLHAKFVSIFGNNDGEKKVLTEVITKLGGEVHHPPHIFELAGKRFLLSHVPLEDPDGEARAKNIDYLIYGHTHQSIVEKRDRYLLINPGECGGWLYGIGTIVILDTDENECTILEISKGEGLQ